MPKNKRREISEDEFVGLAKSHLSEDFPNPERIGCPADSDLTRMAVHPIEARDAKVSKHLMRCSPCFKRYMQVLAALKRRLC
jgi:hypothetical protein